MTGDPERPYGVVLGGSKVSDKLGVIANLLKKADMLFIGGGMVFTFLAAQGYSVGKSLLEEDRSTPSRATSPRPPSAVLTRPARGRHRRPRIRGRRARDRRQGRRYPR